MEGTKVDAKLLLYQDCNTCLCPAFRRESIRPRTLLQAMKQLFHLSVSQTRRAPGYRLGFNAIASIATIPPPPPIHCITTHAEKIGNFCRRLTIVQKFNGSMPTSF
ncbi:MAG: hypothetical protein ETSY2_03390 [Candidatus Entotheonella gemina]|uniref:Uncharacterized protein n=1 Tax=Candidatus Entotheonella gemina TaxID=1429439 RepID=W4MEM7_9BACT|nr:MAG: hypothetical protein ETSY2_03390 [Candidatus Entotheonella gemina]